MDLWRFKVNRGVLANELVDLSKTEKVTQGDQLPGHCLALKLLAIEPREEIHQIVAADGLEGKLALADKFIEFQKVATISRHGVGGEPFFHPHVGQKRRNGRGDFHQLPMYPSPAPAVRRVAIP